MTFRHRVRVRYSDVDSQGAVYNSRYLEYVDHAVTMYLRHVGLVYEELRKTEWDFVLRHADVDWIAPARADEVVDVTIDVTRLGTSSFDVVSEVLRGDGTVLFRTTVTYVGIDPATGGSSPLPGFVRDALGGTGS